MDNQNPIHLNSQAVRTIFHIEEKFSNEKLKLTIEYTPEDKEWLYGGTNDVYLRDKLIFSKDNGNPTGLDIDSIASLQDAELELESNIYLLHPTGGVSKATNITQKLSLYAGEDLLETFEMKTKGKFFNSFDSLIKFDLV